MARQLRRATLFAPFVLLAGFLALSCFDNGAGPAAFQGRFSLVPQFQSPAAAIVTVDRFRVLLRRTADGSVALDTTIAISPGTDSVDLSLAVPMFAASEKFLLTLSLITPAGDTAFGAGPDTVTASSSGGAPPAIPVTVVYTGVGSRAKSVQILTVNSSVFFGDTVTLAAEALDSNGTPIPGTPIAWGSLDTLRARVPNEGVGNVVGVSQRGLARITATLLNGPMDTAAVLVQPSPARMAVEAGNNQLAQVATALAQPVRFRVKAADSLGVSGVVVRFSVASGGGTLSADSAVTNDSGRVDVQWTLGTGSGPQSIAARIKAPIADSVVTALAKASAGPPDSLAIAAGDGQTAVAGAAVATAPAVVVRDSLQNLAPGDTVTFQVTGGGGTVSGATAVTDSLGTARVGSWTLGTVVGANALRAYLLRAPGDTLSVTFAATTAAAAAESLTVAGIASPIAAGVSGSVTLTAKDGYGNVAKGYRGTVHFTSSDAKAVLPADYTFVAGDSGVHAFSLTLGVAGSQSVTATDVGTPSMTGSQTVTVVPGLASPLTSVVTVSSGTVASGGTLTLKLQAKDASGNTITAGGESVAFQATGGTSTGSIGATADSGNGVYTATFTGVLAGTATTIGATINTVAVTTSLPTVTVTPGALSAGASVITVSSPTVASGLVDTLRLQAKDAAGNNLTTGGATVVFSQSGGTSVGTIGATTDSSNGVYVATFTGVTAGTATTIRATVNGSPVATALPTITVTGGAAATLLFTTQPANATVNTAMPSFQVTARDAANNTATGFNGAVTVAFQSNPAGGGLGGTVTVSAVNGVATFGNVSITTVGSGYALQATATGVTAAASQPFLITPVGMTHLWTGAADTAFVNAANWSASPPGAPSSLTDVVFVPASAARQPTLAANVALGSVVVETGASLTIDTTYILSVVGNLTAGYTSIKGPGMVVLSGSGTVAGAVPSLLVMGTYTAADSVNVSGDLTVSGAGHNLTLGGRRVRVLGNFSTAADATLTMTNSADTLDVAGITAFAGGNTTGLLTAGVILARGDFTQVGYVNVAGCIDPAANDTVETFYATGTHRVRLIGTGAQQVTLSTPGSQLEGTLISECTPPYAGGSQFANLDVANPAGVTFLGGVLVTGNLTATAGNVDATGQRISVAGNVTTSANLTADLLEVGGALSFGTGTYSVLTSTFLGSAAAVPTGLPYQDLRLVGTGALTWPSSLALTGSLVIGGTTQLQLGNNSSASSVVVQGSGRLALGGHKLSLPGGSFQTTGNGTFSMSTAADTLDIGGFAYFQGGSTDGLLSDGTILISSNLYQYAGTDRKSFRPTGNNMVVLNGTGSAQGVYFASPGDAYPDTAYAFGDSRFQNLEVTNPFGFSLGSDVYVAGSVTMPGGGGISDNAPGHTLRAASITTSSLVVNQAEVTGTLSVSGTYTVGNTVFSGAGQSIPLYPYQSLTVNGTASMATAPTITGDLTVGAAGQLDIFGNLVTVPGNVNAGNTIVGTGTISMTGIGKTLTGTLPNLEVASGADVQATGTVTVTGTGSQFINGHLALATDGQSTVMRVPGTLEFNGEQVSIREPQDTLYVGGDLNLYGTATDTTSLSDGVIVLGGTVNEDGQFYALGSGNNKVLMNGTGQHSIWLFATNGPSLVRHLEIAGTDTVSMGWAAPIAGNLTISGNGVFDPSGNAVTVGGDLTTLNAGTLSMQNPSDALDIGGNASFQGGSTAGRLTAGSLNIAGNFQQGGTNAQSFSASPGHITSFTGSAAQQITFANPDTSASHFGDFRLAQPSGSAPGVSLLSPVQATGVFMVPGDSAGASGIGPQQLFGGGLALTVGGLNVDALTVDHALLTWSGIGPFSGTWGRFIGVTFNNYLDSEVQFYIHHPGLAGSAIATWSGITFNSLATPTNGGYYVKAEDSDGTLLDTLEISSFFLLITNLPREPDCNTADTKFQRLGGALILFSCS